MIDFDAHQALGYAQSISRNFASSGIDPQTKIITLVMAIIISDKAVSGGARNDGEIAELAEIVSSMIKTGYNQKEIVP